MIMFDSVPSSMNAPACVSRSDESRRAYTYKSLDTEVGEIRLISLEPGAFEDDVKFSISHVPLIAHAALASNASPALEEMEKSLPRGWAIRRILEGRYLFRGPTDTSWVHPNPDVEERLYTAPPGYLPDKYPSSFEALSYSWGPDDDYELAWVRERSEELFTLPLRRNLAVALRYLRHADVQRKLWIDAICINQNDDLEKGDQVRKMAHIYRSAARVVKWLGPPEDGSEQAFRHLRYIGSQIEVAQGLWKLRSPDCDHSARDWYTATADLGLSKEDWTSIKKILQRDFFQRLWIVQESQLANPLAIFLCGKDELPSPLFLRSIMVIKDIHQTGIEARFLANMAFQQLYQRLNYNLDRQLNFHQNRKCENPRDKIYALLGLLPCRFPIVPDYSLPITTVYRKSSLAIIETSKRLDFLSQCELSGPPSWIPNWQKPFASPHDIVYESGASGWSPATWSQPHSSMLEVAGVKVTTVRAISKPTSNLFPDIIEAIKRLENGRQDQLYYTGEIKADVYVKILEMNRLRERWPTMSHFSTIANARTQIFKEGTPLEINERSFTKLYHRVKGSAFFECEAGHLGLASQPVQKGKLILSSALVVSSQT